MTGSIACYKACQVISRLVQLGHQVQVVATPSALQFVGAATLEGLTGKQVVSDLYAAGNVMDHIHLMRWADLVLVAPATANYINKIAQGVGDDLATTLFLAHDFKKPFLLAPAMNTSMYEHPITSKNLNSLREMGLVILDTAAGTLACGESGQGKLLDPDKILEAVVQALGSSHSGSSASGARVDSRSPLRVLITAGGTYENIDGVRVIGNLSTGGTGARLAELFSEMGMDVTLLRAASAASPRGGFEVKEKTYTTFATLEEKLRTTLQEGRFDVVLHAAAVSDFSVAALELNGKRIELNSGTIPPKIHSTDKLTVHFKNNPKLVDQIKTWSQNKDVKLVGFKLTSDASTNERDQAVQKLQAHAPVDFVVQNDTSEINKEQRTHRFTLYEGSSKTSIESVAALASELAQHFIRSEHDSRT